MISYKPSRCNNAHIYLPLLFMLAGFVALLGASAVNALVPAIMQAVGIVFFTVAVFIMTRYSLSTVYYTIGEDTPDLLQVHKINGRKPSIPISVDLKSARKIYRPDESTRSEAKRRVNMCLNILPKEKAAILFGDGKDSVELLIEADAIFFEQIREIIGG